MSSTTLTIQNLQSNIRLTAKAEDSAMLVQQVKWRLSQSLPNILSDVLDHIFKDYSGIIRIEKIRLQFSDIGDVDGKNFVQKLARMIARKISHYIQNENYYHWSDRSEYCYGYFENRLNLCRIPDWAFPDFSPLRYLSPTQSILEILRQSPDILTWRPNETQILKLFSDVLPFLQEPTIEEFVFNSGNFSNLAKIEFLENLDFRFSECSPLNMSQIIKTPNTSVLHLLHILALQVKPKTQISEVEFKNFLSVAKLIIARILMLQNKLQKTGSIQGNTKSPNIDQQASRFEDWAKVIRRSNLNSQSLAIVDKAIQQLTGWNENVYKAPIEKDTKSKTRGLDHKMGNRFLSPVAGLSLLLPYIARDNLTEILSPQHLKSILISTLSEAKQGFAGLDPLIDLMTTYSWQNEVSDENRKMPAIPDMLLELLPVQIDVPIRESETIHQWRNYVLKRLATNLTSLQHSSASYLQSQFLEVPGIVSISSDKISIELGAVPLGIVLQISGLIGDRGTIPFLGNRKLTIHLEGSNK